MNTPHLTVRPERTPCGCADRQCPVHTGTDCHEVAQTTLYRVDMTDEDGTPFCDECAADTAESGLFTDEETASCG